MGINAKLDSAFYARFGNIKIKGENGNVKKVVRQNKAIRMPRIF
jgi:hypothetical protein